MFGVCGACIGWNIHIYKGKSLVFLASYVFSTENQWFFYAAVCAWAPAGAGAGPGGGLGAWSCVSWRACLLPCRLVRGCAVALRWSM